MDTELEMDRQVAEELLETFKQNLNDLKKDLKKNPGNEDIQEEMRILEFEIERLQFFLF